MNYFMMNPIVLSDNTELFDLFHKPILTGELFVSLFLMLLIAVFCFIVYFKSRHVDPLKKPKGIMLVAEYFVEYIDNLVATNMGKQFLGVGSAVYGFLAPYLFLCMIAGLFWGASPITYLYIPVTLGLTTFILIHAVAVRYNHWGYFKRYIDPIPVFLPVNLLSMWAPLLSLSFRLFGNALAGYIIMKMIYYALETIVPFFSFAGQSFGVGMFITPFITPVLHAYFDLFSGFIQTTVFTLLSMALIKNEVPLEISEQMDKEYQEEVALKERIDAQIQAMNTK